MKLQAVFFDMGGTIDNYWYPREIRIERAFLILEILEKVGVFPPWTNEQLVDAIADGMADYYSWNADSNIELPSSQIWSRFLLNSLKIRASVLEPVAEDLAFILETQLTIRKMRPEMPWVLQQIKAMGLKIGIVSNTQSLGQVAHNLIDYGIMDYFDPIVLSSEYGRRKPDPSIFYYAARLANVPTGACIFVGDMINKDILGAQRAGFRAAIQIIQAHTSEKDNHLAVPTSVLQNMIELIPIIEIEIEKDLQVTAEQNDQQVKAIFFDAGDVLYYRPNKEQYLNQFLQGKELSPQDNFESERTRLKNMAFSGLIGRHDYYAELMRLYGLTDPALIAQGIEAMLQDDNSVEILEGVPETIIELKEKGYILGIITDTAMPFTNKLTWFDRHGFGHVWDSVISSKELGVRKPSPLIYQSAIEQTGIRPEEAVFVGHKTSELAGARDLGMKTIAYNYDPDAVADVFINHFCDLLQVPFINR